jgi:hypothetical protein
VRDVSPRRGDATGRARDAHRIRDDGVAKRFGVDVAVDERRVFDDEDEDEDDDDDAGDASEEPAARGAL